MADSKEHKIDLSREDGHQYAVMLWSRQASIRTRWPELSRLYHVENERQCTPQQAARRKRMGVKPGVPDLCLPVARGRYHGLYIELKTPTGKATPDQEWWVERLKPRRLFCRGVPRLGERRTGAGVVSGTGGAVNA